MDDSEFVFGYGSLAAATAVGEPAVLAGHRRRWGVAMDNRRDLPGYKRYLLPGGERPAVFVAFLDLVAAGAADAVNGLCLPVDATTLRALDARERNYERVDVTALVTPARGRVWTYVGTVAGRARLEEGLRTGRAVVSRAYVEQVEAGFRRLGGAALTAFRASTDPLPDGCTALALVREELPT